MLCKRCPHLVRHGQLGADGKSIEFQNVCGLLVRAERAEDLSRMEAAGGKGAKKGPKKPAAVKKKAPGPDKTCTHFPFPAVFDYIECTTYQTTFKSAARKNDVVPTKDFQYSDVLSGSSITDMELL